MAISASCSSSSGGGSGDIVVIDDSPPPQHKTKSSRGVVVDIENVRPSSVLNKATPNQLKKPTLAAAADSSKYPMSPLSLNRVGIAAEQKLILVKRKRNVPTSTVGTQTDPSYFYH